jgi:hypothetical protein
MRWLIKISFIALAVLFVLLCMIVGAAIFRKYSPDVGPCQNLSEEYLQSQVRDNLLENGRKFQSLSFDEKSIYDDGQHLWTVRYRLDGDRYAAFIDCGGGIEMSGKWN